MNWQKFANFAALHLQLGPALRYHIGPPVACGQVNASPQMRAWIENQVEYVVVRPFASLDTDTQGIYSGDETVEYTVWHHIAKHEQPCSRARNVFSDGLATTVAQLIGGLVEWHGKYWALQSGQPALVLDAVVRCSTWKPTGEKYIRQSIEFFLVPTEAQPRI